MSRPEEVLVRDYFKVRDLVEEWIEKQGHDKCWYRPDIFKKIADILELECPDQPLPTREEFEDGCREYRECIYKR